MPEFLHFLAALGIGVLVCVGVSGVLALALSSRKGAVVLITAVIVGLALFLAFQAARSAGGGF